MKTPGYIIAFIAGAILVSGISIAYATGGFPISVPSAPGLGYALVSTTTGQYQATTTDPLHVGSIFATSSSETSTFVGALTVDGVISFLNQLTVGNGGTGSTTLTGILKGNGTSAIQTAVGDTDYQKPITLTTTGSSGAATFSGDTLNIPQYSTSGGTPGGTSGQVQYNASGSFGGVATSTATLGSEFSYSGTWGNFVGGLAGTLHIATGGVSNTMLANSTISGVSLGSNLNSHSHDSSLNGTSYNGSAAVSDWGLNLGHSNWWTAPQNFTTATTSGLEATSTNVYLDGYASALLSVNSSHQVTAYGGASCTNQVPTAQSALGAWTCSSVSNAMLANSTIALTDSASTLTITGSPASLGGTLTATLNLGHSNTWTALQTFGNATTTDISASSEANLPHGTTALPALTAGDVYINDNGTASSSVCAGDGTNTHCGFFEQSAGSTFASSTLAYIGAYGASGTTTVNLPPNIHAMTIHSIACRTDTGTAWYGVTIGAGTETLEVQCTSTGASKAISANNTANGYQKITAEIGTEASTPNTISVSVDYENTN